MTTGEAEQVMSPSSDWILHESYRDALRIIRCQMLFSTLKGTTLFLGWWWHWRKPVVTAAPISIFLMRDLFLVISILAKTILQGQESGDMQTWKGKEKLNSSFFKMDWISVCRHEGQVCQGSEKGFALLLKAVTPPKVCCTIAEPWVHQTPRTKDVHPTTFAGNSSDLWEGEISA